MLTIETSYFEWMLEYSFVYDHLFADSKKIISG